MLLAPNSTFGDYQILFDLYCNFDFRTYVPIPDKITEKTKVGGKSWTEIKKKVML